MAFLIDTDILIYSIKGDAKVQAGFLKHEKIPKYISVISYGELMYGARKSQQVERNLAIVYRIRDLFPVLNVDRAVMETFSELKAGLLRSGVSIDDMDLLIASTALTSNSMLVTNNEKHFRKIQGLRIENWSK
jgi:tRNA(fMet)-specific endonuclease VapC